MAAGKTVILTSDAQLERNEVVTAEGGQLVVLRAFQLNNQMQFQQLENEEEMTAGGGQLLVLRQLDGQTQFQLLESGTEGAATGISTHCSGTVPMVSVLWIQIRYGPLLRDLDFYVGDRIYWP
jgi:hypothetical protein